MSIKFGKNPCKILENIFCLVHLAEEIPGVFVAINNQLSTHLEIFLH